LTAWDYPKETIEQIVPEIENPKIVIESCNFDSYFNILKCPFEIILTSIDNTISFFGFWNRILEKIEDITIQEDQQQLIGT